MTARLDARVAKVTLAFFIALFILIAGVLSFGLAYHASYFLPSIHDEFSYLFQTQTFLLGRASNPPHAERLFFDAYHIINEGVFASKYFPGFALTLMPFVASGIPYAHAIVFHLLCLALIFLIANRLFGKKVAWFAMGLTSFSPQILMQTWLLLSHQTSTVSLLLFLYAFFRWDEKHTLKWAIFGSFGLGLAILTRPLTALGFAFPVIAYGLWREFSQPLKKNLGRHATAWLIPVASAVIGLSLYNHAVTGSYLKTPFDYYAQIHTPYHRYGFDTWNKYAHEADGPRVDKVFNEYYHDHTLADGLLIGTARLDFFVQCLFGSHATGYIALLFALFSLFTLPSKYPRLLFLIWVSLQLVYIPHWYPGILIFGSNYLYEASPLFILLTARGLAASVDKFTLPGQLKRFLIPFATILLFVQSAVFMRERVTDLHNQKSVALWADKTISLLPTKKRLVFVRNGVSHSIFQDFIHNVPTLDSPTILARDRGEENRKLRPYFPDYPFYLLDTENWTAKKLPY